MRKSRNNKITVLILFIAMLAALIASRIDKKENIVVSSVADGVMYVHFIDVGQADSTLIALPSGKNILVDTGTRNSADSLCGYLEEHEITTIDLMVLTHPHENHIGGAVKVLTICDVKEVMMPDAVSTTSVYEKTLDAIEEEGCVCTLAEPGMTKTVSEAALTVLGPVFPEEYDLNNSSIIMTLTYGGTRIMLTGDAEAIAENDILDKFSESVLKCDILKVGHHGSRTSTGEEFLSCVSPEYAIISCGKNNDYGHPHTETLYKLDKLKTETHRTDKEGTVIFSSDGSTVKIHN